MDSRTIIGVLGNLTAFITFLFPARMLHEVWRAPQGRAREERRRTGNRVVLFKYHAAIISCLLWAWYGYEHGDIFLAVNVIGAVMEICYLGLFIFMVTGNVKEVMMHCAIVLVELFSVYVLARVTPSVENPAVFTRAVCLYGNFMASCMKMEYVLMNWVSVSFLEAFASYANAVVWTAYGIFSPDFIILVSYMAWAYIGQLQNMVLMKKLPLSEAQRQRDDEMQRRRTGPEPEP